jgi:hypothetical protein
MNDYDIKVDSNTGRFISCKLRELEPNKLDWHTFAHTHASIVKRGVYPLNMTQEEVREKVAGTFGGKFIYFQDGKFEYVAYTD